MSLPPNRITTDALLADMRWARRIALSLVADEHLADDVVQEAWFASLMEMPEGKGARAWLRRVIRNLVFMDLRGRRRRLVRELAAARRDPPPDTAELVEQAEMHRLLTGLVLALRDPYREAVLLRYFGGFEPSQIAERLDVSPFAHADPLAPFGLTLTNGLEIHYGL